MIIVTASIHFEGPITARKLVAPNASSRPTICLDIDHQVGLYFEDPDQIQQLRAQLDELYVMARSDLKAPVEERIDETRPA